MNYEIFGFLKFIEAIIHDSFENFVNIVKVLNNNLNI